MREIKFRAWDITNKEMFQIHSLGSKWSSEDGLIFGDGRFPIMQYTGLKDKDGKEIYEGDILEHKWMIGGKEIITRGKISFRNDSMGFTASGFSCLVINERGLSFITYQVWSKCELIGNIYENPEL